MPPKVYRDKQETTGKIIAIFFFIFLFFVLFLSGTIKEIFDSSNKIKIHKVEPQPSFRGSIKSADGYTLATSVDTWYFAVNGKYFKKDKHPLIARLIGIYMDQNENEILKILRGEKSCFS